MELKDQMKDTAHHDNCIWRIIFINTICIILLINVSACSPNHKIANGDKTDSKSNGQFVDNLLGTEPSPTEEDNFTESPNNGRGHSLFFLWVNEENTELRELEKNGELINLHYSTPNKIDFSELVNRDLISKEAINEIRESYLENPDASISDLEELKVEVISGPLIISDDKSHIIWEEQYGWCPGNYCIGESVIRIFDIENKRVVKSFFVPIEAYEFSISNDNAYIAYMVSKNKSYQRTLYIYDVMMGIYEEATKNIDIYEWSYDGRKVILFTKENPLYNYGSVSIYDIESQEKVIVYPNEWEINTFSWVPNKNSIIIVGKNIMSSSEAMFIEKDLDTGLERIFPLGRFVNWRKVKWSFDNSYISGYVQGYGFEIFDYETLSLVAEYPASEVHKNYWGWSSKSYKIMYHYVISRDEQITIILNIETGEKSTINLKEILETQAESNGTGYSFSPVW